jgi:hypothetical protein
LEKAEFNLFTKIWINSCEHVAVEGACTVPDVTEEEEQSEGCVAEGEPAAR